MLSERRGCQLGHAWSGLTSCGGSPEAHEDFAEDLLAGFVRVDNVAIE
jgi:hypothetical protein